MSIGPACVLHPREPKREPQPSAERRLNRSLVVGLAQRDLQRGLGAHGPVVAALQRAVRSASTVANGRAQFLASIDSAGNLVHVEVLEADSDYRAWQRAAREARRRLASHRLRVPRGAAGLTMRVEIVSRAQLPSGMDPGMDVSLFGVPLQRGKGDRSSKLELLNPIPKLRMVEVPNPSGGEKIKLPQIQLGLVPFALGADPADFKAPAKRVVKGRLIELRVL